MRHKSKSNVPRNQILNCDCVKGMARLPEECIDLVVTSPPYDNKFVYGGHPWNFEVFKNVADQLQRITSPGGVICWQVKDQSKNGFTCTMHRQLLYFVDALRFRLHEPLYITSPGLVTHKNRYFEQVQVVLVLSKGRPKSNHRIADRRNVTAGSKRRMSRRTKDGETRTWRSDDLVPMFGTRTHLWEVQVGLNQSTKDNLKGFPGAMPEQLAKDLIHSYSRDGDLVLDPFSGSGTTAKMALLEHRDYLGFEVWKEHFLNSLQRLERAKREYQRKLDRILA